MLHTTFKLAKEHQACITPYRRVARALGGVKEYGENTPVPLAKVLEISGLDDALWCLRCVLPEEAAQRDKLVRLLACTYAEHVLPIFEEQHPTDMRVRLCIEVARKFAEGEVSRSELGAARDAAWASAWAAAEDTEKQWQAEQFLLALTA